MITYVAVYAAAATQSRDAFAWVVDSSQVAGALIGVVAILLALKANWNSGKQEERAINRLVAERVRQFEIGLLRELLPLAANGTLVSDTEKLLAGLLGPGVIPLTLAALQLPGPTAQEQDEYKRRLKEHEPQEGMIGPRVVMKEEIRAALLARVRARD